MIPPFDEALADFLARYEHHEPSDLIPVLQRAIEGLRDTEKERAQAHGYRS